MDHLYEIEGGPDRWSLILSDAAGRRPLGRVTRDREAAGTWVARAADGIWAGEYPTRASALRALALLARAPTDTDFEFDG
jgi:hypothetical protein